ncbi:MAG: helix-turn-helix transcriptional regulator [Actinomycetota bacterium]
MAVRTNTGSDYVAAVQAEILAYMGRRRMSQIELARRCDVGQNAMSRWLNGDRLDLQALTLMAEALDVPVSRILADAEQNVADLVNASSR